MKKIENGKERAIELRLQGWSTPKIAKELKVSKSSAFSWTKGVLTEEQEKNLFKGKSNTWRIGSAANKEKHRRNRINFQSQGKSEVNFNSWEHSAGCMLYWAEGTRSKNNLQFTNCNEKIIEFFVKFIKKYYGVKNEDIALTFQYHEGGSPEKIFEYWIDFLELYGCRTTKPYCKKLKSSKTKHINGVCRVSVHRTEIVNRVWGSVQKYIGFSDPDYLECNSPR